MNEVKDILLMMIEQNAQWFGFFLLSIIFARMVFKQNAEQVKMFNQQNEKLAANIEKLTTNVDNQTLVIQTLLNSVMKYENLNKGQYIEIESKTEKIEDKINKIEMDLNEVKKDINRIDCNTRECIIRKQ